MFVTSALGCVRQSLSPCELCSVWHVWLFVCLFKWVSAKDNFCVRCNDIRLARINLNTFRQTSNGLNRKSEPPRPIRIESNPWKIKEEGKRTMASNEGKPSKATLPLRPPNPLLKKPRKIFKFRFQAETSLHNVRRDQIYFYILSLHKKIRSLLRRCKKFREKILKLVSEACLEMRHVNR